MINVNRGERVQAGDTIGAVGYTGNAEQLRDNALPAHLHFMVIRTLEPLSSWRPLSIVREIEDINNNIPHMDGIGFIDPTSWLDDTCSKGCSGTPSSLVQPNSP